MGESMTSYPVPSYTDPDTTYTVTQTLDGSWLCNCPASYHHRICKHIKYVREETMNETTALVPVKVTPSAMLLPTSRDLEVIDRAAQMALAGAITLPQELKTAKQVAAVMLYGLELGLKPMTAIRHLYIVKGRVSPSAEVMAGMLMAAEPDAQLIVEELTEEKCTMRIKRPSRGIDQRYTVTWDEIKKAGLASGNNLTYPRDRLRYHTTKRLLRIYAPEVINNIEGIMLPGAGPSVVEGEITEKDLYNDGDDADAQPPALRQETPVAAPERPQQAPDALTAAYMALVDGRGQDAAMAVMQWALEVYPHAKGKTGKLDRTKLSAEETAEVAVECRRYTKSGKPRCADDDHQPQFDENIAIVTCSECGLELEMPEPAATGPML